MFINVSNDLINTELNKFWFACVIQFLDVSNNKKKCCFFLFSGEGEDRLLFELHAEIKKLFVAKPNWCFVCRLDKWMIKNNSIKDYQNSSVHKKSGFFSCLFFPRTVDRKHDDTDQSWKMKPPERKYNGILKKRKKKGTSQPLNMLP